MIYLKSWRTERSGVVGCADGERGGTGGGVCVGCTALDRGETRIGAKRSDGTGRYIARKGDATRGDGAGGSDTGGGGTGTT